MWSKFQTLSLLILSFLLINLLFLETNPVVWPDEAFYADFSYNFLKTGRLVNLTHPGMYFVEHGPFIYPPLMLYLFALLFKIFGFSLVVQRVSAVTAGLLLLLLLYWLVQRKTLKFGWIFFLLFLSDWSLMRAVRISRPEIYILLLTFTAYFVVLYSKSRYRYLLAGTFLSLAFLFQSYGLIGFAVLGLYIIIADRQNLPGKLLSLALPLGAAILFWLQQVGFDLPHLLAGLKMQALRKSLEPSFWRTLQDQWTNPYGKVNLFYLLLTGYLVIYFAFKPQGKLSQLLVIGLVVNYFLVFIGRQTWYFIYPLVYLYLLLVLYLQNMPNRRELVLLSFLCVLPILYLNLSLFGISYNQGFPSYQLYTKTLLKKIPLGSRVFLSSLPDPYFGLKETPKQLTLYEFPPLPAPKEQYLKILKQSDYVIYTETLDLIYGDLLKNYLTKHSERVVEINNGPNEYSGKLIKLTR